MKLQVIEAIYIWNHFYQFDNAVNDFPFYLLAYELVRIAFIVSTIFFEILSKTWW